MAATLNSGNISKITNAEKKLTGTKLTTRVPSCSRGMPQAVLDHNNSHDDPAQLTVS